MSYSRWSKDCDIYSFYNVDNKIECCGCILEDHTVEFDTVEEFIEHLREHKKAGHKVPDHLFDKKTYEY